MSEGIKRILIAPDVHLTQDGYVKAYELFKNFLPIYQPDITVLLGDFMDCGALSHWMEDRRRIFENRRFFKECDVARRELDYVQKHSKQTVYLEGNHEHWAEIYIDRHPELEGILEIDKNLQLKERDIEWVRYGDTYKLKKVYLIHGQYTNKFHAHKHLITYGCNLIYGHTHQAQSNMLNMEMQKPIMAWGLGCLCSHEPYYMKGKHANWIDQFATLEINEDTGRFNVDVINITDNQFIWNGKEYK